MGLRVPLTSSAAGKILLLNDSGSNLQSLSNGHPGLSAELSQIRQSGLAQEGEGQDPSLQLAAAPIWDDQGRVTASLALNAPVARISPEWGEALKNTAQRISGSLGWTRP